MDSEFTFPIVEVEGTAYECGRKYGEATSTLIKRNIDTYSRLYSFHVHLDKISAIRKAEKYIAAIEQYNADMLDELQGIADGSGTSLGEIVMLNTRTELLSQTPFQECTSFAVLPPASCQGKVWLAQNWDWLNATKGLTILLKVKQTNKPKITMLVEAGHIGKMGLNDAGLGLCVNWLEADKHCAGVPFVVLCRAILNCYEINDAIDAIYRCRRAAAANYLLAHRSGFAVDLETTPDAIDFLEPTDGILVHTNHYISARLRKIDNGLKRQGGDSLVRRQLAYNMLKFHQGHIDYEFLTRVQRDCTCGPYSICTTPQENEHSLAQWSTLAGVIMNLSTTKMYITNGAPCETEYKEVPVFD